MELLYVPQGGIGRPWISSSVNLVFFFFLALPIPTFSFWGLLFLVAFFFFPFFFFFCSFA